MQQPLGSDGYLFKTVRALQDLQREGKVVFKAGETGIVLGLSGSGLLWVQVKLSEIATAEFWVEPERVEVVNG